MSHPELGPNGFAELAPLLKSVRRDLMAAERSSESLIPDNRQVQADQAIHNQLGSYIQQLRDFDSMAAGSNPLQTRSSIIQNITSACNTITENIRPYLRPDYSKLEELQRSAEELKVELEEAVEESQRILSQIKATSIQTGSAQISGYYADAADGHRRLAKIYLIVAAGLSLTLLIAIILVFYVWPILGSNQNGPVGVADILRESIGRLLGLLVGTAAVALCTKNYRVNKHLEIVNMTRCNALNTGSLYVAGVADDAKSIVVSELVRSIFSPGDTGYMNTDREQTIIENPGSLLGIIGASSKKVER